MRIAIAAAMLVLAAGPAAAAEADIFAGEWRATCGVEASDPRLVLEFALTGGTVFVDDGSESAATFTVAELRRQGKLSMWGKALTWEGQTFQRCRAPADRSVLHLSKAEIGLLSSAMPPDNAVFVDARAKGGCKALDYQYLTIDLVGPLGFTLGRWNSMHLAESLADGKKLPFDEVSNWTIDKAVSTPAGVRLTVTELIPPNGSRGDTGVVTLATAAGRLSVPEWKRSYLRCAEAALAAH